MTNQEAIKELQRRLDESEEMLKRWSNPAAAEEFRQDAELYKLAIAAMEKQEPKKPEIIEPCNNGLRFGWCPSCPTSQVCETANYCKTCGQALDWEEDAG